VDIVRLNFSHGTAADHERRAEMVREACRKTGRTVGIMGDLQGPKIRIRANSGVRVTTSPGLSADLPPALIADPDLRTFAGRP